MIYCIGFDGVIAERSRAGEPLRWVDGARDGVRALARAGHEVVVWSERMGPSATTSERDELETFLAEDVEAGTLRIATAERDGPKPIASVYIDARAERFDRLASAYAGGSVSWASIRPAQAR